MSKVNRFIKSEQGGTLVLVALVLTVCLYFLGLVLDLGNLYLAKTQLRKAADSAALSGAQELTNQQTAVEQVVNAILEKYNEKEALAGVDIAMNQSVTVHLKKAVPLYLAGLFQRQDSVIEVSSTASLKPIGKAKGAAPLGVRSSETFVYGQVYDLKLGPDGSDTGNFGILALEGPGAKTYNQNLKYGYSNYLQINDIVATQTGNISGPTQDAVNYRISMCPYPEGETYHRDCTRIILTPVYEPYSYSNNKLTSVKITGFAYFYLLKPMSKSDSSVKGIFIKRAGTGEFQEGVIDRGAYTVKLIQ